MSALISEDTFDRIVDRLGAETAAELMIAVDTYITAHRPVCEIIAVDIDIRRDASDSVRVYTEFRHVPGCPDAHRSGGDHP